MNPLLWDPEIETAAAFLLRVDSIDQSKLWLDDVAVLKGSILLATEDLARKGISDFCAAAGQQADAVLTDSPSSDTSDA